MIKNIIQVIKRNRKNYEIHFSNEQDYRNKSSIAFKLFSNLLFL